MIGGTVGAGIMAAVLAASCVLASYTDIRRGKIYNRHLGRAFAVGGAGAVIYYLQNPDCVLPFLVNLLGALVIAALFYHFKLWGAGDAKFWLLICALYPYRWYALAENLVFPAVYILFFMFLAAYAYVLAETVYLAVRDKNTPDPLKTQGRKTQLPEAQFPETQLPETQRSEAQRLKTHHPKTQSSHPQPPKAFRLIAVWPPLCRIFFYFFALKCFYALSAAVFRQYFWANYLFFALLGILFSLYISGKNISRRWQAAGALTGILWTAVPNLANGWSGRSLKADLTAWLIVFAVMFLRGKMARYNYEEIPTGEVKAGMILSVATVALFQKSRVKGLPEYTDESARCRLTGEQAEAVRRWESSRYGSARVVVVKYLPFGIFMSLGTAAYIVWRFVVIG